MHKPISLHNISLCFSQKICFEDFSTQIHFGSRIALVGRNGAGKSSLLKLLQGLLKPSSGELRVSADVRFAYVPQVIEEYNCLSGGQRFNKLLTTALASDPDVLLLDEPTNHLDAKNRKGLMRNLNSFYGTIIMVTHDMELLRTCADILWHFDQGKIIEFTGNYDDYRREQQIKRQAVEKKLSALTREKDDMHDALMKEQVRAAKSKAKGQKSIDQKKWPTVISKAKMGRAEKTSGQKRAAIDQKKHVLTEDLAALRLPEIIIPSFALPSSDKASDIVLNVSNGSIGYQANQPVVDHIHLSLSANEKIAIIGDNGSGKTTLLKAILDDDSVIRAGDWCCPNQADIGYLDQHYSTILSDKSVLQLLIDHVPSWHVTDIRRHLNHFLFRSNDDVNTLGCNLSGGERARLSLALIAARPPMLLVLDEITNNLDLETVAHVSQILQQYPAALIIVSHDVDFLNKIGIKIGFEVDKGSVNRISMC